MRRLEKLYVHRRGRERVRVRFFELVPVCRKSCFSEIDNWFQTKKRWCDFRPCGFVPKQTCIL